MITLKDREALTTIATAVAGEDEDMQKAYNSRALLCLKSLREDFPRADDETLAAFANALACTIAAFAELPLRAVYPSMDATFTGYSLMAAHVLGITEIQPDGTSRLAEPGPGSAESHGERPKGSAPILYPGQATQGGQYL